VRWVDALSFAGAGLLFGWSDRPKQATMLGAAQDLFELLFATNHINPSIISLDIEPRLRPYGIAETRDFLSRHHIIDTLTDDGTVNHLESLPGYTDPYVAQLRPAIEWIAVNEDAGDDGEILIQGQFGESVSTDDSKVRIGTDTKEIKDPDTNVAIPELTLAGDLPLDTQDELPIFEWNPSFIKVNGRSDFESRYAGMIQIWQGKRYSNIAHLTRWKITFQITRTVGGIFLRSVTMDVYVRAFVSGYRLWPDQDLNVQWPMTSVISAKKGAVGWSASGSEQSPDGQTTVAWDGSGNYYISVPGLNDFRLEGLILIKEKQMDCRLEMSVTDGLLIKTTGSGGTDTVPKEFSVNTPPPEQISLYPSGLPNTGSFSVQFDDKWNVMAGSKIFTDNTESTPYSGKDNCETQVRWSAAQPEFPPEMDRGGR